MKKKKTHSGEEWIVGRDRDRQTLWVHGSGGVAVATIENGVIGSAGVGSQRNVVIEELRVSCNERRVASV